MNAWLEVKAVLEKEPTDWSTFADAFQCYGLSGTIQTDNPPAISAFIAPGTTISIDGLRDDLLKRGAKEVITEDVVDEDWAESWKQFFKPRRIGNHILVRPTWEEFTPEPGDIDIVLDPGQAFGTGDHPTTRLCLELLEEAGCEELEVCDVGCGSGILSVAALKLGAKSVIAIDVDPLSVESSRENAERNGVEFPVFLGEGFKILPEETAHPLAAELLGQGLNWTDDIRYENAANSDTPEAGDIEGDFDLVVSNIISAAIIRLAPAMTDRVRAGGKWIVSGIIEQNWPDVLKEAEACGFTLVNHKMETEWVAATFTR